MTVSEVLESRDVLYWFTTARIRIVSAFVLLSSQVTRKVKLTTLEVTTISAIIFINCRQ